MTKTNEKTELGLLDLVGMSNRELFRLLMQGRPIDEREIENWEFKGASLGLPGWIDKLFWKKFKKVFYRDPNTGALRGWNVRLEQNALDEPSIPKQKGGADFTFGHYHVTPLGDQSMPWPVPAGLLINYGLGGNSALSGLGPLRDPIVAVNEGSSKLILGYMFLDLGLLRLRIPGFFALERETKLTHPIDALTAG